MFITDFFPKYTGRGGLSPYGLRTVGVWIRLRGNCLVLGTCSCQWLGMDYWGWPARLVHLGGGLNKCIGCKNKALIPFMSRISGEWMMSNETWVWNGASNRVALFIRREGGKKGSVVSHELSAPPAEGFLAFGLSVDRP